MSETNIFGGKNPNGQYTPLSEDEQDTLNRLATEYGFRIVIKDWGYVDQPNVKFGDARLQFTWTMTFDRPAVPMNVHYFDIEVWTHTGRMVYSKRMPVALNGQPLQVVAGRYLEMSLDIQLKQINPELVKEVSKTRGLTSRLGNWKLDGHQQKILRQLRDSENLMAQMDLQKLNRAIARKNGQ